MSCLPGGPLGLPWQADLLPPTSASPPRSQLVSISGFPTTYLTPIANKLFSVRMKICPCENAGEA